MRETLIIFAGAFLWYLVIAFIARLLLRKFVFKTLNKHLLNFTSILIPNILSFIRGDISLTYYIAAAAAFVCLEIIDHIKK